MARNLIRRTRAALIGKLAPEDAIAGLKTTKANLEARIPALEAARDAALARRREALISGEDAAGAAQDARVAEDDLAAVADALAEVAKRIAEAVAKREADAAKVKRDAAAKGLEDAAKAIGAATKDIADAVAAVARAHARLTLAVSPQAAPQIMDDRPHLSPSQYADGVLLQALAAALRETDFRAELFPGPWTMLGRVEGREAIDAGLEASERLREAAARVRNGEGGDLRAWEADGPSVYVREPENVPVNVGACFSWIDFRGQERRSCPLDTMLPEPVAEAAVAAGLASFHSTLSHERTRREWEARRDVVQPERLFDGVDLVDLGVDLQADREREEQRQRGEWRAAQDAAREDLERRAA